MSSLAHRARQRRLERAALAPPGNINLVPLVDILTSIVFFSLLTYQGELMAQLTAYDLSLPPVVVSAPRTAAARDDADRALRLVVRLEPNGMVVEHSVDGGFRRALGAPRGAEVGALAALLDELRRRYPEGRDVRVVPGDAVEYDDVVRVLEQLRLAGFTAIALDSGAGSSTVTDGR